MSEDPALVPGAVEEILRWDPPVPYISKVAGDRRRSRWGGGRRRASNVLLLQAAGNRDPGVFEDPGTFDITRNPNDHISLGWGVHFCLGASLARLEGKVVFGTLARRFPDLPARSTRAPCDITGASAAWMPFPLRLGPQRSG